MYKIIFIPLTQMVKSLRPVTTFSLKALRNQCCFLLQIVKNELIHKITIYCLSTEIFQIGNIY